MNQKRRDALKKLAHEIAELRDSIQVHLDDEQEYFDNMPQSFQEGAKGTDAQTSIDALESAINGLDDVADHIEEATYGS